MKLYFTSLSFLKLFSPEFFSFFLKQTKFSNSDTRYFFNFIKDDVAGNVILENFFFTINHQPVNEPRFGPNSSTSTTVSVKFLFLYLIKVNCAGDFEYIFVLQVQATGYSKFQKLKQ